MIASKGGGFPVTSDDTQTSGAARTLTRFCASVTFDEGEGCGPKFAVIVT
jgi:hypothetical protein